MDVQNSCQFLVGERGEESTGGFPGGRELKSQGEDIFSSSPKTGMRDLVVIGEHLALVGGEGVKREVLFPTEEKMLG